jgi:hypothetical protein
MIETSDAASDKLQALISIDLEDADDGQSAGYCRTCRIWFAALTGVDRALAERIREVLADGNEAKAEWLASALPAAPLARSRRWPALPLAPSGRRCPKIASTSSSRR